MIFKLKMFWIWKIKNPIKYKICSHKEIVISGGGFDGKTFTIFSCKKCLKQFKLNNYNLLNNSK